MSAEGKAVFLSYASQDAEAAKRICEALRAAGVEVWFDQSELRGGDSWDRKIREQIRTCALFVPIISANTQSRAEGYFRLEWKLAVDRSHLMADDAPFLFPIVIGEITDATARVPDKFREVQWSRLKLQETAGEIAVRVARLLSSDAEAPPDGTRGRPQGAPLQRKEKRGFEKWWWLIFPIMGMSVPIIGVLKRPAKPERSPPATATAPVQSEARGLVAKARHLFEVEDPSLRENLTLAEDLLLRAAKLDEFDGEVWAAHAQLSGVIMDWGIDRSDERRAAMRRQSDRALQLAPESNESWLAKAWFLSQQRSSAADAVPILENLIERMPDDGRPAMLLGNAMWRTDRPDDAIRWFEKAAAFPRTAASAKANLSRVLYIKGRLDEADRVLDESLAIRPLGMALVAKLRAQVLYRGDLDGAVETLKRIPSSLLLDERGAYNAYRVWLWRREPDKALRVLRDLPLDFIDDVNYLGPKAVLVAAAEELAGRLDLAKGSWEFALHQVEERLKSSPNDEALLYHRALCLTKLGRTEEAGQALRRLQQAGGFWGFCRWPGGGVPGILLKLGRPNEAFDELESQGDPEKNPGAIDWLMCARPVLSLSPDFEAVRDDPRFNAILERAAAASGKGAAASTAPVDAKSIAVLPFANLSPDPDNAYFVDGIHDDIITSLFNVGDLHAVSRTSVVQYRNTTKSMRQIAQELGVAYLLEGTVQRADKRIRVSAKLIMAGTEKPLWAKQYNRDLDDIFAIQSELALEITRSLQAVITPEEKSRIERLPTENLAAYDLYLKARDARHRGGSLATMETLLRAAVELDATFADAWSELARVHAERYFGSQERTPERLASARTAIDRAVRLAPDSPEVIRNLGNYWLYGHRDFARASEQFEKLARLRPNDPEIAISLGENQSRQGRWTEAMANFRKATQLDRSNIDFANRFREFLRAGRRWDEAIAESQRIAAMMPDRTEAAYDLAFLHFRARGSQLQMEEFFASLPADQADSAPVLRLRLNWAIATGDHVEALRLDRLYPANEPRPSLDLGLGVPMILYAQGDVDGARARVAAVATEERARFEREPSNHWALWKLGLAEAILGNKEEALRCSRLTMEMMSESIDAREGPRMTNKLALIYAWAGEKERAIDETARQLRTPNIDTDVHLMRHDPWWFPLRGDPRFEALLDDPKNNAPLF